MNRICAFLAALLLSCAAFAASNNATLETLTVRATGGATLVPPFSPQVTQYSIDLPSDIGALHVRGSAWNGRSKLKLNDQAVGSLEWRRFPLAVGANRIAFNVVAPDGTTSRDYVIHVRRDDIKPIAAQYLKFRHEDPAAGLAMPYRLFVPAGAEKGGAAKFPLVVHLHGGGQNGDDNEQQLLSSEGATIWAKPGEQAKRPAFVLVPQSRAYMNGPADKPIGGFGVTRDREGNRYMDEVVKPSADVKMAIAVIEKVMKEYPVDPKRVYVTGLSQGGFGTWNMAIARPELFAAIVPIAGGGDPALVKRIRNLPVWGFQAADDQVVDAKYMRATIEALRKAGGKPKYTELPSGTFFDPNEHWSWVFAHRSEAMREWMFEQRRRP